MNLLFKPQTRASPSEERRGNNNTKKGYVYVYYKRPTVLYIPNCKYEKYMQLYDPTVLLAAELTGC
jgi:hypothetical protein